MVDGCNVDDLGDHRPGRRAASEHGVRSPLIEAELNKEEIRALSRARGLPTWDKPAMACLASRVPYGTAISIEVLDRIGAAEASCTPWGCGNSACATTARSPASRWTEMASTC